MQKPITKNEKLLFTIQFQIDKLTNEILSELYEENYNGYVDLWPIITEKKGKLECKIEFQKLGILKNKPSSHENATRFHVLPGKGCRLINE